MAVDPTVYACGDIINIAAVAGVKVGELVYWDATNTRVAEADADSDGDAPLYAQYVVVKGRAVANGDIVGVSRFAIFDDADLAYTIGGPIFLSATAGGITQTAPTPAATQGALLQEVGRAMTATRYEINIRTPYRMEVPCQPLEYTGAEGFGAVTTAGTPTGVALDTGTFEGWTLNAQNEYILFGCRVPDNAIALIKAVLANAEEAATSRTITFTVASAIDDAAHDAVTADSLATQDIMAGTADDIMEFSAGAAFDAANIIRPGAQLAIKVNAADTGTEAVLIFGMTLVFRCV